MHPEEQIVRVINTQRRSGVTVYAAICNFSDDIQFMLADTTNGVNFKRFLRQLKGYTDARYIDSPCYLVCDNHTSHASKYVKKDLESFKVMKLPAHSSFLSSVETVFAVLKQKLSKHMARLSKELE